MSVHHVTLHGLSLFQLSKIAVAAEAAGIPEGSLAFETELGQAIPQEGTVYAPVATPAPQRPEPAPHVAPAVHAQTPPAVGPHVPLVRQ